MKRSWVIRSFGGTMFAEGWQLTRGEEVAVVPVDELIEMISKFSDLQDKLFEANEALNALQMGQLK